MNAPTYPEASTWCWLMARISKSDFPKLNDKAWLLITRRLSFLSSPSQRGTALSHTTLPSLRMHEMVCEPWVLTNPSSHRKEMELPSWRFSPKRFPFTGTPGSGHSLWRKAAGKNKEKGWRGEPSTVAQQSGKDEKQKWVTNDGREVEVCKDYLLKAAGLRQRYLKKKFDLSLKKGFF